MHRALRRASRQLTELAASESRFRDLTELSADWFWETDAEHRITWISAGGSVATLFGNLPTFGKRFWEIPRVEVEPRALEAHLERLGEQLPFFDLEIQRTDERGARLIHIISGQSRVTPRGEFLGYRGCGRGGAWSSAMPRAARCASRAPSPTSTRASAPKPHCRKPRRATARWSTSPQTACWCIRQA